MPVKANDIRDLLRNPISWFIGAVASVFAVAASFGIDPITAIVITMTVVWNNAMTMFTASSIIGFTIGPEVGFIDSRPFKVAAIILGFIVAGQALSTVWDRAESRLRGLR